MKNFTRLALVSGLLAASGGAAFAQTANYTFEEPIFHYGDASPSGLNNKASNSGSLGVKASFTSSPLTTKAEIDDNGNGVNSPNGSPLFSSQFSGQFLNSVATNQTITVTLNTAFTNLSLDFYVDGPGMLTLNSSGGSVSQVGTLDTAVGNNTYTAELDFSSATPFTSFTLVTAATTGARPQGFGIDNLSLTTTSAAPTPAPSSALILGAGLLYPLAGLVKRRREKSA